jgi:hypothetical protein
MPVDGHTRTIIVEAADGRVAGAFLENGFLDYCAETNLDVHLLTPGARYEPFVARYGRDGVRFTYLSAEAGMSMSRLAARELWAGQQLLRLGLPRARRVLWRLLGQRLTASRAGEHGRLIEVERPVAVVTLNASIGFDLGITAVARRMGIPTLGNVFSWDHPFRVQRSRADRVTCWSDQVKTWLVDFGGYFEHEIDVIGAPAMDSYFAHGAEWGRETLCAALGLDPARPIIVFATLGQIRQMIDETDPFRELMLAVDAGTIPGRPQVVLRLHPLSIDYYFEDYRSHPDVVFSRYLRTCPGMRWWPSRDETILAGNLLRHADVCMSPGSTMVVEPAIFDTPTIVPVFNKFTTEESRAFFESNWMDKHFRFLKNEGLVPFAFSPDEMVAAVNRSLSDRSWMSDGRRIIRERLLGPLDGHATQRCVEVIQRTIGPPANGPTGRSPISGLAS